MKPFKRKFIILIAITALLLISQFIFFSNSENSELQVKSDLSENILYVKKSNPNGYRTIEEAIRSATTGQKIFVYEDIYKENIVIDKPIVLIGENKNTVIDGGGEGDVVKIISNGVSLSNFTIYNSGMGQNHLNDATIKVLSDNNIIFNNICKSTNYGIFLKDSMNNKIINNTCHAEYDGIWLFNSEKNYLRNNSLFKCGIVIDGTHQADFIQDIDFSNLANNKSICYLNNKQNMKIQSDVGQVILVNCRYCTVSSLEVYNVTDGIQLFYSDYNDVVNNKIIGTVDFGLRLVESDYNTIKKNIFMENPVGIGFKSGGDWFQKIDANCNNNVISENVFTDNYYCGLYLDSSDKNKILKNNFIENGRSIFFQNSKKNRCFRNYYDDWIGAKCRLLRFMPKLIIGTKDLHILNEKSIHTLTFDFIPAKRPYDY